MLCTMTVGAEHTWEDVASAMRFEARGATAGPYWSRFRGVRKSRSGGRVKPTALHVAKLACECLTGQRRHRDCVLFELSMPHLIKFGKSRSQ